MAPCVHGLRKSKLCLHTPFFSVSAFFYSLIWMPLVGFKSQCNPVGSHPDPCYNYKDTISNQGHVPKFQMDISFWGQRHYSMKTEARELFFFLTNAFVSSGLQVIWTFMTTSSSSIHPPSQHGLVEQSHM